jgi:hypothetical protein
MVGWQTDGWVAAGCRRKLDLGLLCLAYSSCWASSARVGLSRLDMDMLDQARLGFQLFVYISYFTFLLFAGFHLQLLQGGFLCKVCS